MSTPIFQKDKKLPHRPFRHRIQFLSLWYRRASALKNYIQLQPAYTDEPPFENQREEINYPHIISNNLAS